MIRPPRIYGCKEWGADPAKSAFSTKTADGIVIHHAVFPNRPPLTGAAEVKKAFGVAQSIQDMHRERGWQDTGNHFTISRGGVILEGRHTSLASAMKGLCPRGAHAGDNDANDSMFGVELEGTYHLVDEVTPEQWTAVTELFAWLSYWGKFDTQNIYPHNHFKATQCPGLVAKRLPQLREDCHALKLLIIEQEGKR